MSLAEILYFNDLKFKISQWLVSLEFKSAWNSSLNENNLNKIELPYLPLIAYCEQQCYGNWDMQVCHICDSLKPVPKVFFERSRYLCNNFHT